MSFDFNKAFVFSDDGLILENGAHLISGSGVPVHLATNPTVYFRTNNEIYLNDGAGSGWVLFSGSGSSFDIDSVLTDNFFDTLVDNEGNVLTGV